MQNKNEWEEGFQLLIEYNKEFGDCLVQAKSLYCDYKLGSWVGIQRYKKDNLTSEKILRLDAVGFVWSSDQAKWEEGLRLLVAYKKEFGNCLVPAQFQYHDFRLGSWVEKRRRIKDKLTTEQIGHLDKLGFLWDLQEYRWEEGFKYLLAYKEEFGGCFVKNPTKYHDYNLYLWVSRQRIKQNKLTPLQIKRLDALGFIWNLPKYRWEKDFKHLVAYKEKFGDCLVQERNRTDSYRRGSEERKEYRRLERWVIYLRWVDTDLRTEQVNSLNKLGFEWDPQESFQWKNFFEKLVAYKEKFGDCLVEPSRNFRLRRKREYSLASWVSQKRSQKDGLTPEQVNSLDDLGFVWDSQEAQWETYFKHLVAYKEKFGDCLVEEIVNRHQYRFHVELAEWVSEKRWQKDELTPEQVTRLDGLGFVWDEEEAWWQKGFKELVAYKKEFGDCLVATFPQVSLNSLVSWVSRIRTKRDRLTPEQVNSLDDLGFVWDSQEAHWETYFKHLVAYKEEFGDCLVWRPFRPYNTLASWVGYIRSHNGSLFPDQVTRLDELGFVWDAREADWETHFNVLVAYKEEFRDCWLEPINADLRHPYNTLADWVSKVRSQKDRLTPEEVTRLDEIGFVWQVK